jgi:uncharacterized protein YcnI
MTTQHTIATRQIAAVFRATLLVLALLTVLVLLAAPAWAHVSVTPASAPAGESMVIDFRIGHGCDGSPTTAVSVQIPDTVAGVTPEFLPGWSIDTTTGPLAGPVELHGETVTEGIREITWSGGTPIPDGSFFDFGVSMQLPDQPGETLYFPVVQTCESGETAWTQVPAEGGDAHDLETPAPAVTLTDGVADAGDGHDDASEPDDHSEAASASEPVATAELATSGQSSPSILPMVLVAGGIGLAAGLAAMVIVRRRSTP